VNIPPIQSFEDFEAATVALMTPVFSSKFGAVSWRDMLHNAPPHRWLVKNLLTEGELAMIAGGTQSGKTFAALDLSMAIVRGLPWCDLKVMQGGVIYQAGEDPTGVRTKRLPAYCKANGLSFDDDVDFTLLTGGLNLWHGGDDRTAEFIAECRAIGDRMASPLRLIVIDTYAKATTGADEAERQGNGHRHGPGRADPARDWRGRAAGRSHECGWRPSARHGQQDRQYRFGADLPAGDHERAEARRFSEIVEDADGRKVREITNDIKFGGKIKNGDALRKPLRFVLRSVEIGKDEDGDAVTSCVLAPPAGEEIAQPDGSGNRQKLIGTKLSIAMRALKAAIDANGRKAPATVTGAPGGMDCVTLSDWRNALAPMMAGENEDENTLRERAKKARDRAAEELIVRKYIVKHGDWIWRTGRKVPGLDYIEKPKPPEPSASDHDPLPNDFSEVPF
jgi:hypothetical protein